VASLTREERAALEDMLKRSAGAASKER